MSKISNKKQLNHKILMNIITSNNSVNLKLNHLKISTKIKDL